MLLKLEIWCEADKSPAPAVSNNSIVRVPIFGDLALSSTSAFDQTLRERPSCFGVGANDVSGIT